MNQLFPLFAVDGLVQLARAERAQLGRTVYNITAFNPSAEEIRSLVMAGFPGAEISFEPDLKRQAIVDDVPGVTRDRNYAIGEWCGSSFLLVDTGGYLPESKEIIDQAVREQVQIAIEESSRISATLVKN